MKRKKNKKQTLDFTLIELIIVIAIIAILASLLLPALSKAKTKVTHVSCQSRLKQFSIAISMYTNDCDGIIPLSETYSGDARALYSVLAKQLPGTGKPINSAKTYWENYLCPATPIMWGSKIVNGIARDADESDTHDHFLYGASKAKALPRNGPGPFATSLVSTKDSLHKRTCSGFRISQSGSGGSGTFFSTPPSRYIWVQDRGFSAADIDGNDRSDHRDGKWNVVFIDGHVKHFKQYNPNRNWSNTQALDDSF